MRKPEDAKSDSGLRGDYEGAAADYTVAQDWDAYPEETHDRWRRLYARQSRLCAQYGAPQYLSGLARLDCAGGIPRFEETNAVLSTATGWKIVPVPGFIPDGVFFDHLANRRFPVTRWIRDEHELDYLVEPDVFHDFFGHVPILLDPTFADFLEAYGRAGERAMAMDALDMLARIYWYTVEFGLIDDGGTLKAFGAGIVSSAGETVYSVTDPDVLRLPFDPVRIMRTAYTIDTFQKNYFVLDNLDQLMRGLVELDFGPIYQEWRAAPPIPIGERLPGEQPHPAALAPVKETQS
ncbi:phenylalanine-4-hydroxylase [Novosphingobium marinum]|uniref:Phenylalanine-4-hydroxylase n=1 Tax=Novosphingobium marinum TaxID=1514948 RepID=A0A7Z0BUY7_9SPHN|nr:phenylalanine 4-monooxygenase [Novosphingobium marinum]NYH94805.1 phenylalanine-4-hydroxylase [Novosphingobium marinum]GGC37198.1 phenylalanine-4-hydroxylase [Novosphingobium marinum]